MGIVFRKRLEQEALMEHFQTALGEMPEPDETRRQERAAELVRDARAAPRTIEPHAPTFGVVVGFFAALLGISILVDSTNWVDDPTVYSDMATTALGAVVGFLTGDAIATATS
jgi:hypothetical protein